MLSWTRVHAIINQAHGYMHLKWSAWWVTRGRARKLGSWSDGLKFSRSGERSRSPDRHRTVAIVRDFWCVRSPSRGRLIFIVTITIGRLAEGSTPDRGARDRCIVIVHLTCAIGRQRSFLEERCDRGAIEPRSHDDRIAIERRLHSFSGGIASRRPDDDRRSTKMKIMARSRRDRGPIAARSCRKSCLFRSKIEARSPRNWSHNPCPRKRLHDAWKLPPRTRQLPMIIRPISLFKSMYFPSLFFNFWSTREEIKRVSRKVLSSRDPLLPRV